MASRIHAIIPRLAIALGLVLPVLVWFTYVQYTRPYEAPRGTDVFNVVRGRWEWSPGTGGCFGEWHRIRFAPDYSIMYITASKPYKGFDGKLDSIAIYDILAHTQGWIRGAIRGETRRTTDGRSVVWDLVLRSPDTYAWHRTDWIAGMYTREIHRCAERWTGLQ